MEHSSPLSIVILAAGKGTRMKSDKAKVLHEVFYAPMIHHVLNAVTPLGAERCLVVIGHQREAVQETVTPYPVRCVIQENQLGTGHAVLATSDALPQGAGTVMVLCGDTPLIQSQTLEEMYASHRDSGAALTIMTTILSNPTNYGRILCDEQGRVSGIVEEKDATAEQRKLTEINAGIYCVDREFLFSALGQVGTENSQGEVYLTDIVSIAVESGLRVERYITPEARDVLGVNSRLELAQAHHALQQRRNAELMLHGVTMYGPETITVAPSATVGRDTLLMGGVHLLGDSTVGEGCRLGPGVVLEHCHLGDSVEVGAYSVLRNCTVADNTRIQPHSIYPAAAANPDFQPR